MQVIEEIPKDLQVRVSCHVLKNGEVTIFATQNCIISMLISMLHQKIGHLILVNI